MKREPVLPGWTEELKLRYLAGEASMFLLHGNVRDVHPWTEPDGTVRYVPIRELLERFLGRTKDIVVYYNVSEGFEFPDKSHRGRFMTRGERAARAPGQRRSSTIFRAPRAR